MRVAGFMSGSGSNLVQILKRARSPEAGYEVVVVFTDNAASRAREIADAHGVPWVCEDILAFYEARGHKTKKDLSLRPEFDRQVRSALSPFRVDVIALAGYMSIVSEVLIEAWPGRIVNVHPADLSILKEGRRAFTGAHAVRDCILAGLPELRSTTHVVRPEVDGGEILLISRPLPVTLPPGTDIPELRAPENRDLLQRVTGEHQEMLKRQGDWVVFPLTLEWLAGGRFGLDARGMLTLDGKPAPRGVKLDEAGLPA